MGYLERGVNERLRIMRNGWMRTNNALQLTIALALAPLQGFSTSRPRPECSARPGKSTNIIEVVIKTTSAKMPIRACTLRCATHRGSIRLQFPRRAPIYDVIRGGRRADVPHAVAAV